MGQGVPFQNDSSQLLINLPTKQMSLNLDDDEEFWKWYQEQSEFKLIIQNIFLGLYLVII